MTKKILLLLIFMVSYSNLLFAQHNEAKVNKVIQDKWINETVIKLKKSKSFQLFKLTDPKINSSTDSQMITYRVIKDARIQCSGGEWIYITMHSIHENKEIGDVCIAISNKGKMYVNYGHVCGGIVHFVDESTTIPEDANDFFDRFVSDDSGLQWLKWK